MGGQAKRDNYFFFASAIAAKGRFLPVSMDYSEWPMISVYCRAQ